VRPGPRGREGQTIVMARVGQSARLGLVFLFLLVAGAIAPVAGWAAPYAALVMDARTGEVIHARNADTRLHPASLTKMMTLYIAFQAIQRGEISLDTEVTITRLAAAQPPSRLGLRTGQTIRMRYLLRAAAIRSANDAATAIGIALAGSESAFAARMNATAAAMGMTNTHFVNMNGLTAEGHFSTARDMSVLGRHLIYDFPQYYNLFSRRTADAGMAEVANTNRRFLDSYEGADGIKTGYTVAAGYNLVASAQRDGVRIIATVFGGTSTANRNARVTELLDMGFGAAPHTATVRPPDAPGYAPSAPAEAVAAAVVAANTAAPPPGGSASHTIRMTGQVLASIRPLARPGAQAAPTLDSVSDQAITDALALALGIATDGDAAAPAPPAQVAVAAADTRPAAAPDEQPLALASAGLSLADVTSVAEVAAPSPQPAAPAQVAAVTPPEPRPAEIIMTAEAIAPTDPVLTTAPEVVTRLSTSGGANWGINVGRFNSSYDAERALIQVAIAEAGALTGGVRRITQRSGGFDANIVGLSREAADLACRRLQGRAITCFMLGSEEG